MGRLDPTSLPTLSRDHSSSVPLRGAWETLNEGGVRRQIARLVVISDSETQELGHAGHRAIEELEVAKGELNGSGPMRTRIEAPLGLIEER